MARMNKQKAQGKLLCGHMTARSKRDWDEVNNEWVYTQLEIDPDDESTFNRCGRSKKAHGEHVKNPITDHPYGGEDGTLIYRVMPKCGVCQREIEKGEEYRFWAPRYGARQTRCMTCPSPSRSSMTNSEILSMAWDIADEGIEVGPEATEEDLDSMRDDYAERIGEIVSLIEEKMDNIESGFGHTSIPAYEELDERKGMYEQWQEEVEAVDFSDFTHELENDEDPDAICSQCGDPQSEHGEDREDGDTHDFEAEPTFDSEGAIEALQEALGACPE